MKRLRIVIGFSVLLTASSAIGAPSHTVKCPPVIADKTYGTFAEGRTYKCFSDSNDAKRAGFINKKRIEDANYTGWWRLALKLKSDTCPNGAGSIGEETTIFLQLLDTADGLYGDTCPSEGKYSGIKTSGRSEFSLRTHHTIKNDSDCGGADADLELMYDIRGFDPKSSKAGYARLTRLKSCGSEGNGTFRCSTVWEGSGGREKPDHRFWPTVPFDTTKFHTSCQEALATCSGCHNGI